jgi:hypothetical protein
VILSISASQVAGITGVSHSDRLCCLSATISESRPRRFVAVVLSAFPRRPVTWRLWLSVSSFDKCHPAVPTACFCHLQLWFGLVLTQGLMASPRQVVNTFFKLHDWVSCDLSTHACNVTWSRRPLVTLLSLSPSFLQFLVCFIVLFYACFDALWWW